MNGVIELKDRTIVDEDVNRVCLRLMLHSSVLIDALAPGGTPDFLELRRNRLDNEPVNWPALRPVQVEFVLKLEGASESATGLRDWLQDRLSAAFGAPVRVEFLNREGRL